MEADPRASPEQLFSLCGTLVLPGWLLLIFLPRWRSAARLVCPVVLLIFRQAMQGRPLPSLGAFTL